MMSKIADKTQAHVFNSLSESKATLLDAQRLDNGMGLTRWKNGKDCIAYHAPSHHTLSYYIDGGYAMTRKQGAQWLSGGAPEKICMLPARHESNWISGDAIEFMHLYFDQQQFIHSLEHTYDRTVQASLPDINFADDEVVAALCQHVFLNLDWQENTHSLALSTAANGLMLHIAKRYLGMAPLQQKKHGLSPHVLKTVLDYLEAHLDSAVTLTDLAQLSQLSMYHFARMFKISTGTTPHQYVIERRLQRAYERVCYSSTPLAVIADQYGFSDQSHFTKQFKARFGKTPKHYRRP